MAEVTKRNIGIIEVAPELLLDIFNYKGGAIHGMKWELETNVLRILIEHPDMPLTPDDEIRRVVRPTYFTSMKGLRLGAALNAAPPKIPG